MAKKKTRVLLPGGIQGLVHDLQNGTSTFAQRPIVDNFPVDLDDQDEEPIEEEQTPEIPRAVAAPAAATGATTTGAASPEPTMPTMPTTPAPTETAVTVQGTDSEDNDSQAMGQGSGTATYRGNVGAAPAPAIPAAQTVGVQGNPSTPTAPEEAHGRGRRPKENTMKEYHIVKDDSVDSWQLFLDMAQQYKTGGGKLATIYIDESLKSVLDRMKYAGTEKLSTSAILSSIVARFIYDHEEDIRKVLFSGQLI